MDNISGHFREQWTYKDMSHKLDLFLSLNFISNHSKHSSQETSQDLPRAEATLSLFFITGRLLLLTIQR